MVCGPCAFMQVCVWSVRGVVYVILNLVTSNFVSDLTRLAADR